MDWTESDSKAFVYYLKSFALVKIGLLASLDPSEDAPTLFRRLTLRVAEAVENGNRPAKSARFSTSAPALAKHWQRAQQADRRLSARAILEPYAEAIVAQLSQQPLMTLREVTELTRAGTR